MSKYIERIPLSSIERIAVVFGGGRSMAQVKGNADYIMNGGFYDMTTGKPVGHLEVNGTVHSKENWNTWGFAWDKADLRMVQLPNTDRANYISGVPLLTPWDGIGDRLTYNAEVGGSRPRTAMALDGENLILYCADSPTTPEKLRDELYAVGAETALMLDSGGSTQCSFNGKTISSSRRVHNYIAVWLNKYSETDSKEENTMFKIALGAGHGINTAGKRCLKAIDPNETREWFLNDRICDYIESKLKFYEGYELLRLDDSDDGGDDVSLSTRTNSANNWGADFYLSVHHNAGINGGSGGGIEAYAYTNPQAASVEWRDALYDALITHTGLKGNRSNPKGNANFHVLRETQMPATLLELGYMDSTTDVPVILTDEYAQKCADAIVEVIVKRGGLTKKAETGEGSTLYKVQVGAFAKKENANRLLEELKAKGYSAYVVEV